MESASGVGRISLAQGLSGLCVAVLRFGPSVLGMVLVQWLHLLGGAAVPALLTSMGPKRVFQIPQVTVSIRETTGRPKYLRQRANYYHIRNNKIALSKRARTSANRELSSVT